MFLCNFPAALSSLFVIEQPWTKHPFDADATHVGFFTGISPGGCEQHHFINKDDGNGNNSSHNSDT